MNQEIFIAGSVRTPLGSFCSAFADFNAVQLGTVAAKAAIERSGVAPDKIDEVFIGNILSGGLGPNAARQIGIHAGIPDTVPATTVNVLCGSGMKAVTFGIQSIIAGDNSVVLAGGIENMSRAPYLLENGRTGYRMGNGTVYDSMFRDALIDAFDGKHMGACGDAAAAKYGFSRDDQDNYAIESYKRAQAAMDAGVLKDEIAQVEIQGRKGVTVIAEDEEPRKFNEEKFRKLRPAFGKEGTTTAGNASGINDGAAALVVLSADSVKDLGVSPQAKILGYAHECREPEWFTLAPIKAIDALLKKLGWSVDDVDLFEINEAFSVVPMAAMKDLNIPHEKVNVHGGAICMGHPVGASGARVIATLINALKVKGLKKGIASLCIGGGQGIAMAIELC